MARRRHKILGGLIGGVLVLIVAIILFVAFFDWNRLKPFINEKVSEQIGRTFVIQGNLSAAWSREDSETGWRHYVPWPTFTAENIEVGQPGNWTRQPLFAHLDALKIRISPLPLLVHHAYLPGIWLAGPSLDLERDAQGRANWNFVMAKSDQPSDWKVDIGTIGFAQGKVDVDDAQTKTVLHITVSPLQHKIPYNDLVAQATNDARADVGHDVARNVDSNKTKPDESANATRQSYQFAWTVKGNYGASDIDGIARTGGVLAVQQASEPFPVQARIHIGDSKVAFVGTLTDPMHLGALDLRVWFAGSSMAKLYPLTGITLPETPPYATEGHLQAELHKQGSRFSYRDFHGTVGDSDIGGNLQVVTGGARPRMSGDLHSKQLRFADLAPLIGADNSTEKKARGDTVAQPSDKVLPVEQFHTDRLRAMDADVTFDAAKIVHPDSFPIDALSTHIYLDNGQLRLDPLHAVMASGTLNGRVSVNGGVTPMQLDTDLQARHLQLKQLFPNTKEMANSAGQINGDLILKAHGNSVAALLGDADGEVRFLMNDGAISKTLLETAGLNVANVIVEKLFGDKPEKINCAAADLTGEKGLFTSKLFLLDTEDATINVSGTVNFANEQLNLDVTPHTKGLRIFSLRSPLYAKGTLKNPSVGVQPLPLILRGGGAVALGIVAAPAALLAMIVPSHVSSDDQTNACQPILDKMRGTGDR